MKHSIIPIQSSLVVIRQSNGSLSAQHDCQLSPRSGAWYLFISVHFLLLLTKAFRWDISAVSSCSFERWFVNYHFELIQYCQQPGISGRQITSPVFTHPVVFEPCPLCSETNHSSFVHRVCQETWIKQSVKCRYLTPIWDNLQLFLRIFLSVVMNDMHDVKCIFLHVVINLS